MDNTSSVFTKKYPQNAIIALDALVASKTPIFLIPSWHLSTDAAQAGFLLSSLISHRIDGTYNHSYRSFFSNSSYESIHAAIKLMRHQGYKSRDRHNGRVIILDSGTKLSARTNPVGTNRPLIPNLVFEHELGILEKYSTNKDCCGVIIRKARNHPLASLSDVVYKLKLAKIPVALDLTDNNLLDNTCSILRDVCPDLILVGEALTDYQVPFSALCGTPAIFSVWSEPHTAFLHSNTYGGNTLAMRLVRDRLIALLPQDNYIHETLAQMQLDRAYTVDLYARHVNPITAKLHRRLGGALNAVKAVGSKITVELDSGKTLQLVDGICGGGLGVNGHNPHDTRIILSQHDSTVDYVEKLEKKLATDTGLSRMFPAVSGATAVETAITLAMLARPQRKKIIVFHHNYGGKTLVSLLATAAERSRQPFGPLYPNVCYLDPFAPDAIPLFEREIAEDDVGLVWLEIIHGSSESFSPLPELLLRAISEHRMKNGYLIGVDEVLMSYFRCGRQFSYISRLSAVDIITLSKALSYLCFPIGAAVVSEEVYQAARIVNHELVDELKEHYRNNLGAHIALHSISQVQVLDLEERCGFITKRLNLASEKVESGRTVKRCLSEGLFVKFELRLPKLPKFLRKAIQEKLQVLVMIWWIRRARILALDDCFTPHLIADNSEIEHMAFGLERLARMPLFLLILQSLTFQFTQTLARKLRGLRTHTSKGR